MPPDAADREGQREKGARSQSDPEVDLILRAQSGDPEAFGELVRRHQSGIFALTMRMIGEAGAAEELTQDTFLRAWRTLRGFRRDSRFSTWLYRIAVNVCRDHLTSLRTRQRRRETSLDAPGRGPLPLVIDQPGPDERAVETDVAQAFQGALMRLDPEHRTAFLLRHQEGLSPAEIAEVLGISVANAKVRVHRARQAILASLRRLGYAV